MSKSRKAEAAKKPAPLRFKLGDVVRLKSGGPDMTIGGLHPDTGIISVVFFNEKEMNGGVFHQDAIQLTKPRKK